MDIHIDIHIHMHIDIDVHIHVHVHKHIHVHVHVHIHIHIHMHASTPPLRQIKRKCEEKLGYSYKPPLSSTPSGGTSKKGPPRCTA